MTSTGKYLYVRIWLNLMLIAIDRIFCTTENISICCAYGAVYLCIIHCLKEYFFWFFVDPLLRRQNLCSVFLYFVVRGTKALNISMRHFFFHSLFLVRFQITPRWEREKNKKISNCIPAYNNVLKYHILCFCKTFPCLLYNFMQEQQQVHVFGMDLMWAPSSL